MIRVRMIEGTYEDNNQNYIRPVAFPMHGMTNPDIEEAEAIPEVTLYNEEHLEHWAAATFGDEYGIFTMEVPDGALVSDD